MPTIGSRAGAGAGGWVRGAGCGGLGAAGGEKLQDKKEDKVEASILNVIEWYRNVFQRVHAYHWQQS